jgi:hypothetical protein
VRQRKKKLPIGTSAEQRPDDGGSNIEKILEPLSQDSDSIVPP